MTTIEATQCTKVLEFDRQFDFKEGEILKILTYTGDGGQDSFVRVSKPILVIEKTEGEEKLSETILTNANLQTDQVLLSTGGEERWPMVHREVKVDGAFSIKIKAGDAFRYFRLEEVKLNSTKARILKDGSLWIALDI